MINLFFQYLAIYIFIGWLFNIFCEIKLLYDLKFNFNRNINNDINININDNCKQFIYSEAIKNIERCLQLYLLWPIGLIGFIVVDFTAKRVLIEIDLHLSKDKKLVSQVERCSGCINNEISLKALDKIKDRFEVKD